MELYITTEQITEPVGGGNYVTIFERNEVVQLVSDNGPFPQVRKPGEKEKPRAVSWSKLKPYHGKK